MAVSNETVVRALTAPPHSSEDLIFKKARAVEVTGLIAEMTEEISPDLSEKLEIFLAEAIKARQSDVVILLLNNEKVSDWLKGQDGSDNKIYSALNISKIDNGDVEYLTAAALKLLLSMIPKKRSDDNEKTYDGVLFADIITHLAMFFYADRVVEVLKSLYEIEVAESLGKIEDTEESPYCIYQIVIFAISNILTKVSGGDHARTRPISILINSLPSGCCSEGFLEGFKYHDQLEFSHTEDRPSILQMAIDSGHFLTFEIIASSVMYTYKCLYMGRTDKFLYMDRPEDLFAAAAELDDDVKDKDKDKDKDNIIKYLVERVSPILLEDGEVCEEMIRCAFASRDRDTILRAIHRAPEQYLSFYLFSLDYAITDSSGNLEIIKAIINTIPEGTKTYLPSYHDRGTLGEVILAAFNCMSPYSLKKIIKSLQQRICRLEEPLTIDLTQLQTRLFFPAAFNQHWLCLIASPEICIDGLDVVIRTAISSNLNIIAFFIFCLSMQKDQNFYRRTLSTHIDESKKLGEDLEVNKNYHNPAWLIVSNGRINNFLSRSNMLWLLSEDDEENRAPIIELLQRMVAVLVAQDTTGFNETISQYEKYIERYKREGAILARKSYHNERAITSEDHEELRAKRQAAKMISFVPTDDGNKWVCGVNLNNSNKIFRTTEQEKNSSICFKLIASCVSDVARFTYQSDLFGWLALTTNPAADKAYKAIFNSDLSSLGDFFWSSIFDFIMGDDTVAFYQAIEDGAEDKQPTTKVKLSSLFCQRLCKRADPHGATNSAKKQRVGQAAKDLGDQLALA